MELFCRNIVSTVNLGCRLDLKKIALHARNAEYNPKVRKEEEDMAVREKMDVFVDFFNVVCV